MNALSSNKIKGTKNHRKTAEKREQEELYRNKELEREKNTFRRKGQKKTHCARVVCLCI